jgi:hypothetical protein
MGGKTFEHVEPIVARSLREALFEKLCDIAEI